MAVDDISAEYDKDLARLNEIISQVQGVGTYLASLVGADQTAPFCQERDRIIARWQDADSAGDDAGRIQAAQDITNLRSSAEQALLGVQGDGGINHVPMGMAPPSVDNTLGGNIADQAGKVGTGLAIGGGFALVGVGIALALYLFILAKK